MTIAAIFSICRYKSPLCSLYLVYCYIARWVGIIQLLQTATTLPPYSRQWAKMSQMSVCRYTHPDLEHRLLSHFSGLGTRLALLQTSPLPIDPSHFLASRGPYSGSEGPSVMVVSVTLLLSGSVSGARRAKMSRMSVCRYTRPDLEHRNLSEQN